MRQWGVDTKILCAKHLLGEHLECHMIAGAIRKRKRLDGFLHGLIDVSYIEKRHSELVEEMRERLYNHNSPLVNLDYSLYPIYPINLDANYKTLFERCEKCKARAKLQLLQKLPFLGFL